VKETKSYHNRLIPLSESAQKVIAPFLDEPIVFHHSGRMIHTRNATDWYVFFRMNVAKSDLSIEIKREIEQSTLHSLRHSLATHLRFAGVHDAVVRYYCGWELDRDKDMLTRYSHAEMYLQECADMIDQLFSGKILSFSNAVNYQNK
jgi:integrase